MVHVSSIFSVDELEKEIAAGYVNKREHPSLPLYILNYSEKVQFSNRWNDVTLNCRGLIVDAELNVIARPWKKFMNYGQGPTLFSSNDPVEVTDKKDGSLGILYPHFLGATSGRDYSVATRGSFVSDQAIHATEVWRKRYSHLILPANTTFLFEIIY